jgi:5'-methylthioadenosine phosphorylase
MINETPADEAVQPVIGIIGGSGLYDIDGLEEKVWRRVETPWGDPSDELLFGRLGGTQCVFLPRHGRGHSKSPTHLNYRANIDALKRSGVTDVLSLSAVGSLKPELPPGHFVVVDQFIDRSFAREKSFFGDGCRARLDGAPCMSPAWRRASWCSGCVIAAGDTGRHLYGHGRTAVFY